MGQPFIIGLVIELAQIASNEQACSPLVRLNESCAHEV